MAAGIVGVILLLALANGHGGSPSAPVTPASPEPMNTMVADGPAAPVAAPVLPVPENWSYSTDEDKVRGATTYFARTTSTNTVHQDPPYDAETSMTITIRRSPAYGTDVLLTISSGQLMCPSYDGCTGTVRFDKGPAQEISFNGSADNSSDTIFVANARSFVAKLKRARKVVVEKTLYEAGNPQFEFDVSGLNWSH